MSSVYRCQGCGNYARSPGRRVGLGSVCSEACATAARTSQYGGRQRHGQASAVVDRDPSMGNRDSSRGCAEPSSATTTSDSPATTDPSARRRAERDLRPRRAPTRAVDDRDQNHTVLARDTRCRYCGTTRNLHVHHIVYRSQGGGNEPTNLITLCVAHHGLVHSDKVLWQPLLHAYIDTFYTTGRRCFLLDLKRRLAG